MYIHKFQEIASKYPVIIFDIWGVIYQGDKPYDNVIKTVQELLQQEKIIVFLSNAPRPSEISKKRFAEWGIEGDNLFFYTSGDLLREQLINFSDPLFKNLNKKLIHIGAEKNEDILDNIEIEQVKDLSEASFILASMFHHEDEDLTKYDAIFEQGVKMKMPLICANPDVNIFGPDGRKLYCSGYFADRYTQMGGESFYYGKPHKAIYEKVKKQFLSQYNNDEILMVGDTIETDILGASDFGIDSALVLTGNGARFRDELLKQNKNIFAIAKPTWVTHGVGVK